MDVQRYRRPVRQLLSKLRTSCFRLCLADKGALRSWNRRPRSFQYITQQQPHRAITPIINDAASPMFLGWSSPFGLTRSGEPSWLSDAAGEIPIQFKRLLLGTSRPKGAFLSDTTQMSLTYLDDSGMLRSLAYLLGYPEVYATHIRPTFVGYLRLCQLFGLRFIYEHSDKKQCLTCLEDISDCGCVQHVFTYVQDVDCDCECLICCCDRFPWMCFDLDELLLICCSLTKHYADMLMSNSSKVLFGQIPMMSFLQDVEVRDLGPVSSPNKASQFEPP